MLLEQLNSIEQAVLMFYWFNNKEVLLFDSLNRLTKLN